MAQKLYFLASSSRAQKKSNQKRCFPPYVHCSTSMFIIDSTLEFTVCSTLAKIRKQLKCTRTDDGMEKLWYVHTMETIQL